MSDVTIRPARVEDDRALAELDRRCWSRLHAVTPRPAEGAPFFRPSVPPEDFLVAEADGRPVGYLKLVESTPLESNRHVRQIQGLVVDAAARGRGVGRALLDAAAREAVRQGAVRLTLRVLGHNAPARRLYEAAGFAVEGVLPGEFLLDGAFVDDVCMGRRLDGATPGGGFASEEGAVPGGGAGSGGTSGSGGGTSPDDGSAVTR